MDPQQHTCKCLAQLERSLQRIAGAAKPLGPGPDLDLCLLEQYEEQMKSFKLEVFDISCSNLSINDNTTDLSNHESKFSQAIFDTCLHIRKLISTPAPAIQGDGIKLPKIEARTYDGNMAMGTAWLLISIPSLQTPINISTDVLLSFPLQDKHHLQPSSQNL